MQVIKKINDVRKILNEVRADSKSIGFVPTMGALHDGHLHLMKESKNNNDYTVVSIFVNPIQFSQGEDLSKYPRDLGKDTKLTDSVGVDLIFNPEPEEILGTDLLAFVDILKLQDNLCGLSRPGHFKGVCTIVAKLFNIVKPDKAYFGKKDIQQLYIIKKMTKDLNFDIDIIPCDIIRENDGLAMSSRNQYLSKIERKDAVIINKSLKEAVKVIEKGEKSAKFVISLIKNKIKSVNYSIIDYVKIVNGNMEDVEKISKGDIIACAVFFGKTRLIDNYIIGEKIC
jgi:pantoate--beta-alanine ligase